MNDLLQKILMMLFVGFMSSGYVNKHDLMTHLSISDFETSRNDTLPNSIVIDKTVTIDNYFQYLDSIVKKYDSITSYNLTEHLLVRSNPWIIDTLKNTDYYIRKEQGLIIKNQKELVVLNKGDIIFIPDNHLVNELIKSFHSTIIDINIPEFKLRIIEDTIEVYKFTVRIGKNEEKYLEMAGRIVDLKTKTGNGKIVNYNKDPKYINPVDGHRYLVTKRDDNIITQLPKIPFIETEINGIRYGQLIHPTTNPTTLGKASSNGCIGTNESDAWVIYYYAPINTKVIIRYDLYINDSKNKKITLKDIYKKEK